MKRYVALLARSLALLAVITVANFFLIRLVPGGPLEVISRARVESGAAPLSDAERAMFRRYYGLDQPLPAQLLAYAGQLLHGDLGYSTFFRRPSSEIIAEYCKRTSLLVAAGLLVAVCTGLPLGIVSAARRGSLLDSVLLAVEMILHAAPPFLLATAALIVFAVKLQWFPLAGSEAITDAGSAGFAGMLRHLALPAFSLGAWESSTVYYFARNSMVDILGEDYIRTARAKGLGNHEILIRHALPALLPMFLARFAVLFGAAIGGVFFAEQVFSYPGLGQLSLTAFQNYDYLLLRGIFLVLAAGILTAYLVADLWLIRFDARDGERA
ncbi:MAG: ABC transporter permease [Bryobacteraceae bacterium]